MHDESSVVVYGHKLWRARRLRRRGRTVAIRARHRILVWQTITVRERDLRYGAEAIARYLDGCHAGRELSDSRARGTAVLVTDQR